MMPVKKKSTAKKKTVRRKKISTNKSKVTQARKASASSKSENKDSLIGIDPLAWLNDESEEISAVDNVVNEVPEAAPVAESESASDIEQSNEEKNESITVEGEQQELKKDNATKDGTIDMGSSLTIRETSELFTLCKTSLEGGKTIKLDCSSVGKTDASGLQLLAVLSNHAKTKGVAIEWGNASEHLRNSAELLGLTRELSI